MTAEPDLNARKPNPKRRRPGFSLAQVVIVDYDPRWPALFEEERARVLAAIGPWLVDIQHVGSSAVPGLAAKPVIDIMPGLRALDDARHCIPPLEAFGYEYMPQHEAELPERRFFAKPPGEAFRGRRTFHLHMVETASAFWERHLLFRDYLRAHPEAAREYGELKRRLAAEHGSDRDAYTKAKTEFITSIEAKARAVADVGRGLETPTNASQGERPTQPVNIRTKSVYEPVEPDDGHRVLTTQYWPRGIPKSTVHEYIRKLAPSRELLHAFKRGEIDWPTFKRRYLQEMGNGEAQQEIGRLHRLAESGPLTLICVCNDQKRCHRYALREIILDGTSGGTKLAEVSA